MANSTLSSQIYSSKDQIVSQITEYLRTYLELENISLIKGSFLSFLVETLAALTSNLVFYESSVYNEFFLTRAKIAESIYNLASFLGYNTSEATYAQANVLMTIPLTFSSNDITISIAKNFKFQAQSIPFITYYTTSVRVQNNSQVSVTVTDGNKIYSLPTIIDTTGDEPQFRFILPVRQYENNIQEFQIDEDLQVFQFTNIDVPLTGKVSTMTVQIRDPGGSSYRTYTEFRSTYLMASDDYGYVSRRTDSGRRLYFGNGLIGIQPAPGSTVLITVQETQGLDGNVISGTINTGQRLYVNDNGTTKSVNYTVINSSPAIGGTDEESLEEIRKNAINNLTSLNRLVTENDYVNTNVIIPNSPITSNSKPVLKRSDVRVNEVQLYVNLLYGNSIVSMKNIHDTYDISTTYIPRGSTITFEGENYYTLFDISIDTTANNAAYYTYIMNIISQVPVLVRSYDPPLNQQPYVIPLGNLTVTRVGSGATFEMAYTSSESDYDSVTCQMQILSNGLTYDMTNNIELQKFVFNLSDYTTLPSGEETYYFTTSDPNSNQIARYSNTFVFRESLNSFMLSNISSDSTSVTVYDIPTIKASYYDSTSVVKTDFETQVLQSVLSNMDFVNYRMLTDFVNLKFTNTTGSMKNMIYNKITKLPVINISSLPDSPNVGDRYIVAECDNIYSSYKNQIAQCTNVDSTSITSWSITSSLNESKEVAAGCGNTSDALCFGGSTVIGTYSSFVDNTEIWNGNIWATTSDLNETKGFFVGCGNTSDALCFSGYTNAGTIDNTEIWNGTIWATTSDLNEAKSSPSGCGITSDALCFGGNTDGGGSLQGIKNTEIWNGTIWATTSQLVIKTGYLSGCGNTSDALAIGGYINSNTFSDNTEIWNGTIWATTSDLNIARSGAGSCGNTSDSLCFGGYNPNIIPVILNSTELWNGIVWTTVGLLNEGRNTSVGCGNIHDALSFSGDSGGVSNTTEIWRHIGSFDTWENVNPTWSFTIPNSNDIVYITNKGYRYLYTGKNWILPIYDIPLQLSLEIFREDTYTGSDVDLAALVRSTLISTFTSRFGSNAEIHRSEIIQTVQGISGVSYCVLISPESDIYFDFSLDELTENQLLEYGPEYMFFTSNSITIRIL